MKKNPMLVGWGNDNVGKLPVARNVYGAEYW